MACTRTGAKQNWAATLLPVATDWCPTAGTAERQVLGIPSFTSPRRRVALLQRGVLLKASDTFALVEGPPRAVALRLVQCFVLFGT
jgi:hypothetical protein